MPQRIPTHYRLLESAPVYGAPAVRIYLHKKLGYVAPFLRNAQVRTQLLSKGLHIKLIFLLQRFLFKEHRVQGL